jgi:hypothetical protein
MTVNLCRKPFFCGVEAQNACFDKHNHKGVYICQEASRSIAYGYSTNPKPTKTYGYFPNWSKMWEYSDLVPEDRRHLYELIKGNRIRVEHYDVEIAPDRDEKLDAWNYYKNDPTLLFVEFFDAHDAFFLTSKWSLKNRDRREIITTESHSMGNKLSFHFIVRTFVGNKEFVFEETLIEKRCMLEFARFVSSFNPLLRICIDFGIYSSNRLFRLLGSSKYGSTRSFKTIFRKYDRNLYLASFVCCNEHLLITREDDDDLSLEIIKPPREPKFIKKKLCSICSSKNEVLPLLTDVEYQIHLDLGDVRISESGSISSTKYMKVFCRCEVKKEIIEDSFCGDIDFVLPKDTGFVDVPQEEDEVDDWDNIEKIVKRYARNNFKVIWTPIKKHPNCFLLKREAPSYCPICIKVHDHIDQYFCLWNKTVTLGCWRASDNEKLNHAFIGRFQDMRIEIGLSLGTEWIVYDESLQWVKRFEFECNLVIKAHCGKGKTTCLEEFIEEHPESSFLILCPRRVFATDISRRLKRFDFISYLDVPNGSVKNYSRLAIQVESLHLLDFRFQFDYCILDECESILTQMFSLKTHGANLFRNHEKLLGLMRDSRCIFMDAFLSEKTVSFVKGIGKPCRMLWYKSPLEKRKAVEYPSLGELTRAMKDDLLNKKKIYFFCSSKNQLIDIHKMFDGFDLRCYHAEGEKLKGDINEVWSKGDGIFTTSSITVGLNFDKIGVFHRLYVFMSASSNNVVRDCFQSIARVRHIESKELRFCLDTKNWNFPDRFEGRIDYNLKLSEDRLEAALKGEVMKKVGPVMRKLYGLVCVEKALSVSSLRNEFERYLELCNYSKEVANVVVDPSFGIVKRDKDVVPFDHIPLVSGKEYEDIFRKVKIGTETQLERDMIKKYDLWCVVIQKRGLKLELIWDLFCGYGNQEKFNNLRKEAEFIEHKDFAINMGETPDVFQYQYITKVVVIRWLYVKLNVLDRKTRSIKRDVFEVVVPDIAKMEDCLRSRFKKPKKKKKVEKEEGKKDDEEEEKFGVRQCILLLNSIFSDWGFAHIRFTNRTHPMINGVRRDVSDIIIEFPPVYDYFKY